MFSNYIFKSIKSIIFNKIITHSLSSKHLWTIYIFKLPLVFKFLEIIMMSQKKESLLLRIFLFRVHISVGLRYLVRNNKPRWCYFLLFPFSFHNHAYSNKNYHKNYRNYCNYDYNLNGNANLIIYLLIFLTSLFLSLFWVLNLAVSI